MNKKLVSVCGLTKSYHDVGGRIQVLKQLNIDLYAGEMVAIVGASGSGKSTLLHLLGGLDRADDGNVFFYKNDVLDIQHLSEKKSCEFRNHSLGFIYQFHYLLPEFTVLENVSMPLWIRREKKIDVKKRALEMLEKVGLSHRIQHRPSELSGGERQRVAIARALVTRPMCVLADELTGNLDKVTAHKIIGLMKKLAEEIQSTMVLVTHDLSVAALCDRQYTLQDGRLNF